MHSWEQIKTLESICAELRKDILETLVSAQSGHAGGPMSSVELMASLYFSGLLKMDYKNPENRNRDKVLVRGHLGPLRYSIFSMLGFISKDDLATYRKFGSRLQGHEDMTLVPSVDITPSGSLGMLLSYGVGSALSDRNNNKPYRTWVFLGDGEEQEGNVSEAARHASNLHLENLICVMDKNSKQLSTSTSETDSGSNVAGIWSNYGWDVLELSDGHSIPEIIRAYETASRKTGKPTIIIAPTEKGKGLMGAKEHISGYHKFSEIDKNRLPQIKNEILESYRNKPASDKDVASHIEQLREASSEPEYRKPSPAIISIGMPETASSSKPLFTQSSVLVAAVAEEASKQGRQLYYLYADVVPPAAQESVNLIKGHKINVGVREQHSIGMAHGISKIDPSAVIFIHACESFTMRSADQFNVLAQSDSSVIIMSDTPGLCGAFDGSTHQSSGQPGVILAIPGMSLYEPADVADLRRSINKALERRPSYIRVHNQATPQLPRMHETFEYQIIGEENNPQLTVIASGLETGEAFKAKQELNQQGIDFRLINAVALKSLSGIEHRILDNRPCLTFYNGNPFVLSSVVAAQLMQKNSARPSYVASYGFEKGKSGSFPELLRYFQLDKEGIKTRVLEALR
ncbi:MAG: transketolase C-terminal domain-containing protein [Candidatus Woesearchaeota archaeon]